MLFPKIMSFSRSGKPKGIAYVEYSTDQEASKAIMKLDGTEVRGHTVSSKYIFSFVNSIEDKSNVSDICSNLCTTFQAR